MAGDIPPGKLMLPDPFRIEPLDQPPDATVVIPGSKSITNRALLCAGMADGDSVITGALVSDDTEAMVDCLGRLGATAHTDGSTITVAGTSTIGRDGAVLDARLSGTTSRFVAPVACLGGGSVVLDGAPPLRRRPMADLWDALTSLGAKVEPLGDRGHLPVRLSGGPGGLSGGQVEVRGSISSQYLTGLLLAAPLMPDGLRVSVSGVLVSQPYVEMTIEVMRAFGAEVVTELADGGLRRILVAPKPYVGREYAVEPDASTASYFFALAAAGGGRVRVEGLGRASLQGDLGFATVLASMGADVDVADDHVEVRGTGRFVGADVNMVDISDTAPTLAAISPLAVGPTTVSGIGFARGKETDRIAAVVAELTRLGVNAVELPDGFAVEPGDVSPGVVETYDDHRMAMSFAVLGLLTTGVSISDPGCVAKTFPGFWDAVERLRAARFLGCGHASHSDRRPGRVRQVNGGTHASRQRLGLTYLDTGAMYRAVAFAAIRQGIDPDEAERVACPGRSD